MYTGHRFVLSSVAAMMATPFGSGSGVVIFFPFIIGKNK